MRERLQKVLADAGVASRRKCEEIIAAGRVTVDGRVVTAMGVKVDPEVQDIRCDGEPVRRLVRRYFALHKPRGVLSVSYDPRGRPTVADLVPRLYGRLYPVGRLDASSEGLIILTNDGAFANCVTHPRHAVPKTYDVHVQGYVKDDTLEKLLRGVPVGGRPARAQAFRLLSRSGRSSRLEIVIAEGRKRIVRRMLRALGHPVLRLRRTRIGNITLGGLRPGAYRPLTQQEVQELMSTCTAEPREKPMSARRRKVAERAGSDAETLPHRTDTAAVPKPKYQRRIIP